MFLAIDIDPNIYLMLYSFSVTINLSIPNVHQKNLLFCHRTQAIVLHHMFFNNYLEFSIACGNIFIPSILLWWNIIISWSRSMIVYVVRRRYNERYAQLCIIMRVRAWNKCKYPIIWCEINSLREYICI